MDKTPKNYYVVIIAGGVGTRLWPKSRKKLPKQFFHLNGDKSLARLTYERLDGFVSEEKIFVVAPEYYQDLIKRELPKIPSTNYILEPDKRGTTAANAISAMIINKIDPTAVIHFLVADDYLTDNKRFHSMSLSAHQAAEDGSIVVFGVKPKYPNTGFGYIKVDKKIDENTHGVTVFKAEKFVEKPNEKTARKYFNSGKYYVHGSGFAARADVMLNTIFLDKKNGSLLKKINDYIQSGKNLSSQVVVNEFKELIDVPIEYSLLEKATSIKMVTLQDDWNDVGAWSQVFDIMPKDKQENVILGNKDNVIVRNSFGNLIFADKRLIAVTDMKNTVVVDTDDALIVCPMPDSHNIKQVVEILKEKKLKKYL